MSRQRNLIKSMPENCSAITPHDTNLLAADGAVYVGGDGDVCIYDIHGNTVTFKGMSAGDILPVKCRRVMDTNTDATNLILIY